MITNIEEQIGKITLKPGGHKSPKAGLCVMEAAAMLAGEKHSDSPACVCPVVRNFCIGLNDHMPEEFREKLKRFLPRIIGSVSTADVRDRRRWMLVDAAIRIFVPLAFRAANLPEWAEKLESLPEITDRKLAMSARVVVLEAKMAAYADANAANAANAASANAAYTAYTAACAAANAACAAACAAANAAECSNSAGSLVWGKALEVLDAILQIK